MGARTGVTSVGLAAVAAAVGVTIPGAFTTGDVTPPTS